MSVTPTRVILNGTNPTEIVGNSDVRRYARISVLGPACAYFATDAAVSPSFGFRVAAGDSYLHDDPAELWAITVPGSSCVLAVAERAQSRIVR